MGGEFVFLSNVVNFVVKESSVLCVNFVVFLKMRDGGKVVVD